MPVDHLALERARVVERRLRPHRPQVRVQAEPLAQSQQTLLGPRLGRVGRVPLGAADGGEQDRIGRPAGGQRLVGEGDAVGVDRGATEEVLLVVEAVPTALSTSSVGGMISGPIPSPGSSTILDAMGAGR